MAHMYCSALLAIHSGHPIAVRSDTPTLQAWQSPVRVTVGTPIHSVSQVVVVPAEGKTSSAMSNWPYEAKCARLSGIMPDIVIRLDSRPKVSKWLIMRC